MSLIKRALTGYLLLVLAIPFFSHETASGCTSIALKAEDGAVAYGRTMEWGTFDLNSRLVIVPRGYEFQGHTPDGKPGYHWTARYGVVALDMVEKDYFSDGMNEKGLVVGVLYHPGFLGIPGDYTPPSRFVRAVAYTQTARKTPDGDETVYEVFRIMDNFNLPLGSAEGPDARPDLLKGMRSSTSWTSAADTKNLKYYYHTQHNRKVRMVDLKKIDFSPNKVQIKRYPLDKQKSQDIEDVTPQ